MMHKVDRLTLITGADIILKDRAVRIEQPTLKKIALMGEEEFLKTLNIFFLEEDFTKMMLEEVSNNEEEIEMLLSKMDYYDHLMFMISVSIDEDGKDHLGILKLIENLFSLILPKYKFVYNKEEGLMFLLDDENSKTIVVDGEFFNEVRDVALDIFMLNTIFARSNENNEMSEAAKRIAEKIAKSEKKIREMNGEEEEDGYFSRIVSVLGAHNDLNELSNLTVYQLHNKFERFNLYLQYDQSLKSIFAGAKDVEVVDWYKKI